MQWIFDYAVFSISFSLSIFIFSEREREREREGKVMTYVCVTSCLRMGSDSLHFLGTRCASLHRLAEAGGGGSVYLPLISRNRSDTNSWKDIRLLRIHAVIALMIR
jgi:hypothetical protein